jgi:SUN domain-containing protein 1/2
MLRSRAPTLASRSPTKPTSPVRDRRFHEDDDENENEPALARFARQKQREQASINNLSSRPGGPKTITSPPKPEKWSVKDTSVNIATAFTQAANDMLPAHTTPNTSWASTSSRTVVPRSTSVEYESQVQTTTSRRLAAPTSKLGSRPPNSNSNASRKPLSKADSSLHVPDSEDERPSANGRGKSPLEQVAGAANRALQTATFYLRARSKEPPANETSGAANNQNGNDSSYDYGAEESIYQASQGKRTSNAAHKRNRISIDNKAWKPSASDIDSDEEYSDDGKKGRGKKKGLHGGPLTNLPTISASKSRKRKTKGNKGSKGNIAGGEHENESDGETQTDIVSGPDIIRKPSCPHFFLP